MKKPNIIDSGKVTIVADIKNAVKNKRGRPQHLPTATTRKKIYNLSLNQLLD